MSDGQPLPLFDDLLPLLPDENDAWDESDLELLLDFRLRGVRPLISLVKRVLDGQERQMPMPLTKASQPPKFSCIRRRMSSSDSRRPVSSARKDSSILNCSGFS